MGRIELVVGDITEQDVDAIVNAANSTLLGGGGVDGAIHRVGGPAILEEARKLGGAAPGEVKPTGAGKLSARYVLHAVGPMWRGGNEGEADLLAACHRRALELASELECRSVAFPAISTGVYGYPVDLAAPVAIEATRSALAEYALVEIARFVFRGEATLAPYRDAVRFAEGS